MVISVRGETCADFAAIRDVIKEAFEGGKGECEIVDKIRQSADYYRPRLSLVAFDDIQEEEVIIGHIMLSKVQIQMNESGRKLDALALAPLSVLPNFQVRKKVHKVLVLAYY